MSPTPRGSGFTGRVAADAARGGDGFTRQVPDPVILSYLEGKTNEEVAAILNWPVGTVKGRLYGGGHVAVAADAAGDRRVGGGSLMALSRTEVSAAFVPEVLVRRTVRRVFQNGDCFDTGDAAGAVARPGGLFVGRHVGVPGRGVVGGTPLSGYAGVGGPPSGTTGVGQEPVGLGTHKVPLSPSPFDREGLQILGDWVAWAPSALVLLTFAAADLIGGFASSAAYGGKFPNLRPRHFRIHARVGRSRGAMPSSRL